MTTEEPRVNLTDRLSAKDAAAMLQVSKRSVLNYITNGQLKASFTTRKDEKGNVIYSKYRILGRDLLKFWKNF